MRPASLVICSKYTDQHKRQGRKSSASACSLNSFSNCGSQADDKVVLAELDWRYVS